MISKILSTIKKDLVQDSAYFCLLMLKQMIRPVPGNPYLLFLLAAFLLASCAKRRKTGEDLTVFRYNEPGGISSLDPAYARNLSNIWGCNQLYNGLVELDEHLKVKPAIARSWEISSDGRAYTFHLRDDVHFHPHALFQDSLGRKVTAHDFVYSFKRIVDPGVASPGAWVFRAVDSARNVPCFHAKDDSTLVILLKKPFPPFLSILGMKYCSVVPREIIDHFGRDFRRNPIGTGPFYLKYWQEGIKLVLRKNKHYFQKDEHGDPLPYLDAVSVTFLMDKQSAFLEFIKGKLDFMSGIDPAYKDEVLTPYGHLREKYRDRFYLLTEPYLNTEYLGFLVDQKTGGRRSSPVRNEYIRKAINYGFDREKMITYLRNNIGIPGIYGFVPPGLPSFDSVAGYSYRPDSSRLFLSKAGFPNGEGLSAITLSTTAEYLDLCKFIQHQLGELGMTIELQVNPPATNAQLIAGSRLDFFRASWIADYPDAENYLSLFYSKNFSPSGPNYTHYQNPVFDKLYRRSQHELVDTSRYRIYREMDRVMLRDAPVVILYYDEVLRFVNKRITGLGINPVNLLDLRSVRVHPGGS